LLQEVSEAKSLKEKKRCALWEVCKAKRSKRKGEQRECTAAKSLKENRDTQD
jgi:Asp-tRNA(Asn)/Glu-tRNA(Gln) amidotransferase C subunit